MANVAVRLFDLNIEEVLDNWEVSHALREIISNAFDEQTLSRTDDVVISKDDGRWSITDFGRGLRIEHFTLNENQEKLDASTGVIGKFGVGLKDALATFHRRGVDITITSAHGDLHARADPQARLRRHHDLARPLRRGANGAHRHLLLVRRRHRRTDGGGEELLPEVR